MTKLNIFTSDLIIDAEKEELEGEFVFRAEELAQSFEKDFDWYNNKDLTKEGYNPLKYYRLANKEYVEKVCKEYSEKKGYTFVDATSCVKGLFLQNLCQIVQGDLSDKLDLYKEKFLLSFGGDLFGTDLEYSIQIEGIPLWLKPTRGPFYCFTSGNYGRRGRHILEEGEGSWKSLTVCGTLDIEYPKFTDILSFLDCYTTDCYSYQSPDYLFLPNPRFIDHLTHIWVNLEGNIEVNPILTGKGGVQWFI